MSLWDVDKTNDNRAIPVINADDGVYNRMAHATEGIAYRSEDATGRAKTTTNDDRITVNDGTNTRIGLGRMPNGEYGLVITKAGKDITNVFS